MKEPQIPPMTQRETDRVETLEHLSGRRSVEENRELQLLYLHRWAYVKMLQGFARLKPVVAALTGRTSWGKSKGSPLLIIPVAPPVKWSLVSAIGSATTLISMEFTPSQLTVLGMVAGLITSMIASMTSIFIAMQGRKAAANAQAAILENTKLTEKTSADVETVKKDVDGMKSRDESIKAEQAREIASLKQQLSDAEKRAVALARATTAPVPVGGEIVGTLKQINRDTTAIDKNTASTETKVDALNDKP